MSPQIRHMSLQETERVELEIRFVYQQVILENHQGSSLAGA
jgi:hypothetical protein